MARMAHCRYVTAQRSACPGQHCGIWPISTASPNPGCPKRMQTTAALPKDDDEPIGGTGRRSMHG